MCCWLYIQFSNIILINNEASDPNASEAIISIWTPKLYKCLFEIR